MGWGTKGQAFIRQRTASTVRQETGNLSQSSCKESSSEKDEFEEDTDSEEARLLSVSNTRPFYLDHHLQTAIQKEALIANKFKRFRDQWVHSTNALIYDEHQTQTAKVLALPQKQYKTVNCQDISKNTPQPKCDFPITVV